jgi:NAD(P)-dependent dehydrogenase (short-subunit alcohol dehydrogenase family)
VPSAERNALIIGAASGIGAAGARALAADGWGLVLLDRLADEVAQVGAEVGAMGTITVDVADPEALGEAIEQAVTVLGGIDAVWSNAGVQPGGSVEEASVADLDLAYAVNIRAHFVCAQRAVPHLRRRGGGSLLITASNGGLQTEPKLVAYATTKAAAVALARLLARDHASDGIRVNALCPGFVDTPFNRSIWETYGGREQFLAEVGGLVPLGRMATPEEIAGHVRFLLSEDAAFMTGTAYVADGGELVR